MNSSSIITKEDCLVTIGVVTDLHYARKVYGNRYCNESLAKLNQAIDTFQSRAPDTMVNLGDSIDTGESIEEEFACLQEIEQCFSSISVDTHFVIGNHDVAELTKERYLTECGAANSSPYYSFECGGVHIIILDSNFHKDGAPFAAGNFSWDDAWLSKSQIAWLESDLKTAHSTPTLVFCHGNLDYREYQGAIDPHIVRDAPTVRSLLEQSGSVIAVIQGHYHPGTVSTINEIPYITLRAMVEGSGLGQNAYTLLSITKDEKLIVEGFGQQRSTKIAPLGQT